MKIGLRGRSDPARALPKATPELIAAALAEGCRAEAFAALEARMFRQLPQHDVLVKALRDAGPLPGAQEVRVTGARGSEEGADLSTAGELAMLRLCPGRLRGGARSLLRRDGALGGALPGPAAA